MTQRIFDSHLHIIDPAHPLVENNGFMPAPFTVGDYQTRIEGLEVVGGAVVSGSFQAFDQAYLIDALRALGPSYVGVTQIPANTTEREILDLHEAGVRAVRFNVARGGSADLDNLEQLAHRVYDLVGWHAELYIDARSIDEELSHRIVALPAVSIDHPGMHRAGLQNLLRLVVRGVQVKATGFGRIDLDPVEASNAIIDVDPTALMVGTDLPSTRARRPFQDDPLEVIGRALPPEHVSDVFWNNAAAFYLSAS